MHHNRKVDAPSGTALGGPYGDVVTLDDLRAYLQQLSPDRARSERAHV